MVIVSQDRETIVNFDRITEIVANDNEVCITDDIYKEYGETIGTYATKERTKEILKEIWNFYEVAKRYECSSNNGMAIFLENRFTYQMPKE